MRHGRTKIHAPAAAGVIPFHRALGALAFLAAFASGHAAAQTAPIVVTTSVQAHDPNGYALTYQWRSTDGVIVNQNAASTTWTLPGGPGLHFAYALVSNGHGGYDERRVAVNTDNLGTSLPTHTPVTLAAPPQKAPVGETYRGFITNETGSGSPVGGAALSGFAAYMPNLTLGTRTPAAGSVTTSAKGEFFLGKVKPAPDTDDVEIYCATGAKATFQGCGSVGGTGSTDVEAGQAVTDYVNDYFDRSDNGQIIQVLMADGAPCGTSNEFFGVKSGPTATLLDANKQIVLGPMPLDAWGQYSLPTAPGANTILFKCEKATPVSVPIAGAGSSYTFPKTARPVIDDMSASLNGTVISPHMLPLLSGPSDIVKQADKFLAYKGLDSRQSACLYYTAIGAITGCDAQGNMQGAVNFDDWKRAVKIDGYAVAGTPEYAATYINRADLNLAREHHSISYSPKETAAYVCNHLGPSVLDPAQSEIDTVVDNTVAGKNLVACVAMDYGVTTGVNGNKPFTRFYIFGPSGELLPSVNLDGRREKFVPGTCVVCHSGTHYAGQADGRADVGGKFLPYDTGNFEFSSKAGLTEANQERQIFHLNQNVLRAGPTVAEQELIAGWYAASKTLDKNYLPASWLGQPSVATNFYRKVIARSCRGCHVAQVEGYNWDHLGNFNLFGYRYTGPGDIVWTATCGGGNNAFRQFGMPNSLVTFNRFWNSAGTGATDQPLLTAKFINYFSGSHFSVPLSLSNCAPAP